MANQNNSGPPSAQLITPTQPVTPVAPTPVTPVAPTPITPVQPQTATPVQPAAPALSPTAPSGPVNPPVAICCPDVAYFEKSGGARSSYAAFDDTTNLVPNPGADEYWIPPTDAKTLPGNKQDRDGAAWVSVGVGRTAQVTIKFDGNFTIACIAHCTYEVDPVTVAEVTGAAPGSSGAVFTIRGKAAGEASLKVMCNGVLRGYFHIWCAVPATIDVDVASIVTPASVAVAYVASDLEDYINEVFSQTIISVRLNDAGAVTVPAPQAAYNNGSTAYLNSLDTLAQAASNKLTASYRLYYYVNAAGESGGYGIVSGGLGAPGPGWAFINSVIQASYNTMAHELGHLLNLSHPLHDGDHDEFPPFQEANRVGNVLPDDPWNLMGYNGSLNQRGPNRKPLRYLQWKKCNRS